MAEETKRSDGSADEPENRNSEATPPGKKMVESLGESAVKCECPPGCFGLPCCT